MVKCCVAGIKSLCRYQMGFIRFPREKAIKEFSIHQELRNFASLLHGGYSSAG